MGNRQVVRHRPLEATPGVRIPLPQPNIFFMIPEYFLIIGAFVAFAGCLSYLMDTLKGKTQPNRVTWLLWAVVPAITFVAQIEQGVGLPTLLTFMIALMPLFIFIASFFNSKAEWKLGTFDYICGGLAILALVLWQMTRVGNIAIALSILADFFAAIPTIVKSYKYPESENYKEYLTSMTYAIVTLLALKNWGFEYYAFATYIALLNILIVYLLVVRPNFRLVQKGY